MNKGLLTCSALAFFCAAGNAFAQFNDSRTYVNTPIGINQLELGYTYVRSDESLDPSLAIAGATLHLNQGTIDYTRYFGMFHRVAWVEAAVPLASLGGSISGTAIHGSISGAGDSSYQFAVLLKGAPALGAQEFESYTPVTSLGLSLEVTAPTGVYDPGQILNLGSHRWSFKPEITLSCPFGPNQKWEFDAYGNAYFYTDDTSYRGQHILRQQALPALEGHISYSFSEKIWASLDTRYSFFGTTYVDGIWQNDTQQNFILGSELNLSLDEQNSLTFEFAKTVVHHNGPTATGVSIRYDYTWSGFIPGWKKTAH